MSRTRLGTLLVLWLSFAFAGCYCACSKSEPPDDELSEVDRIMTRFAKGIFTPGSRHDMRTGSGWIMTTESGEQFRRPGMQYHAEELINIGPSACRDLVNWLEHERMEIRYIASYSLEQLTGDDIDISPFASLQEMREAGWKNKLRDKFAQDRQTEELIAMRHMGGTKYGLAVFNRSDRPLLLGAMDSTLGFDQFLFKVRVPGRVVTIEREEMWFTVDDTRTPVIVPSGSYHEFAIDFADGTWDLGDRRTESWKAIKVVYQPEACDLARERSEKGILGTRRESSRMISVRPGDVP